MATPNPMQNTYPPPQPTVSSKSFTVTGITTTVYGIEELPLDCEEVVCIWLLHPRLQTQSCMRPAGASAIHRWNNELQKMKLPGHRLGLLAVSFDQRNHGSREVNRLANETWRSGNKSHAQDMLGTYHGTAMDVSLLMTHLSSYVFPGNERTIADHIVLGVSLGGHAAWQACLNDQRISTVIVVIGCPDYVALMSDRARLSRLESWTSSDPPGSQFLGSRDFPRSLVEAVEKYDPAGMFLGSSFSRTAETLSTNPSKEEQTRLRPLFQRTLQGKRILNMAGGSDKLVPYSCAETFLEWLKAAASNDGWLGPSVFVLEDKVFDGVSHEMSPQMAEEANKFILETLAIRAQPSACPKI